MIHGIQQLVAHAVCDLLYYWCSGSLGSLADRTLGIKHIILAGTLSNHLTSQIS